MAAGSRRFRHATSLALAAAARQAVHMRASPDTCLALEIARAMRGFQRADRLRTERRRCLQRLIDAACAGATDVSVVDREVLLDERSTEADSGAIKAR